MKRKLSRFEVISFISETPNDYWEGEEHHKGIYFNETHAYVLSKVFSIKVEHCDNVLPLYYDYSTEDFFEKVVKKYPYKNMKRKPRGRHLLFGDNLKEDEINSIFSGGNFICEVPNKTLITQLEGLKEKISNKRKRQSSIIDISIEEDYLVSKIIRNKEKVTLINSKKMSKVNNATKNIFFSLNANSFFYMLKLFSDFNKVKLFVKNDQTLLVEGVFKKDEKESVVKLAIGLSKGRIK